VQWRLPVVGLETVISQSQIEQEAQLSLTNRAMHCINEKTIQCLPNPSQHVPVYLQQFPSYSNRKCKKIAIFTYRSPHFCLPWRRPCAYHAICCMDGKTIQWLPNPRSMYLSIFHSFRVIRCLSQCVSPKIAIFTYCSPHFCFSWRRPCDYHAVCCMDGKAIQCLPNPSQHVPIYL